MSMIRRIKLSYVLYNIFQRKKLIHNTALYRKLGLKKFYFSPVSSKDFKNVDASKLIDEKYSKQVEETALFQELSEQSKQNVLDFDENGFAILHNYLSDDEVDLANAEIDKMLADGTVKFKYGNKIMFAIHKSERLKNIGEDQKLKDLLSAMFRGNASLFQSINFLSGSEQDTHSDSIHMTTFPLGGLLGVWIALEDIDLDNGPLHYYPGSHKLPYYLNSDYDNEGTFFMTGDKDYTQYEKMLDEKLKEHKLQKQVFNARKGDVLIWHANLMHGGEPHTNKSKTRKSMVLHYFAENSICYHEITQRPALMG